MNMTSDLKRQIEDLILRSAMLIDTERLDDWLDCFEDDSSYIVIPRDNRDRGLPGALMHCGNKARLKDRVACLRSANKFNPHFDRHILSGSYIMSVNDGVASVLSNFMVVQTNLTGASKLFCAGCYEDRIRISRPDVKFTERLVVVDTFSIPTMLATPL
jgi:anthranilate 1,2-dioxygenase small subunit